MTIKNCSCDWRVFELIAKAIRGFKPFNNKSFLDTVLFGCLFCFFFINQAIAIGPPFKDLTLSVEITGPKKDKDHGAFIWDKGSDEATLPDLFVVVKCTKTGKEVKTEVKLDASYADFLDIPIGRIYGPLTINVYDEDTFSFDDSIANFVIQPSNWSKGMSVKGDKCIVTILEAEFRNEEFSEEQRAIDFFNDELWAFNSQPKFWLTREFFNADPDPLPEIVAYYNDCLNKRELLARVDAILNWQKEFKEILGLIKLANFSKTELERTRSVLNEIAKSIPKGRDKNLDSFASDIKRFNSLYKAIKAGNPVSAFYSDIENVVEKTYAKIKQINENNWSNFMLRVSTLKMLSANGKLAIYLESCKPGYNQ